MSNSVFGFLWSWKETTENQKLISNQWMRLRSLYQELQRVSRFWAKSRWHVLQLLLCRQCIAVIGPLRRQQCECGLKHLTKHPRKPDSCSRTYNLNYIVAYILHFTPFLSLLYYYINIKRHENESDRCKRPLIVNTRRESIILVANLVHLTHFLKQKKKNVCQS